MSVAIAKDTLFVSFGPTLLEQVLRGGPSLDQNPQFQLVAKEFPAEMSGFTYVRLEDSLRQAYDIIKSGKLENPNPNGPKVELDKVIDVTKLPDFSVIAKYLSPGGAYFTQEEDGLVVTGFMLHKANP